MPLSTSSLLRWLLLLVLLALTAGQLLAASRKKAAPARKPAAPKAAAPKATAPKGPGAVGRQPWVCGTVVALVPEQYYERPAHYLYGHPYHEVENPVKDPAFIDVLVPEPAPAIRRFMLAEKPRFRFRGKEATLGDVLWPYGKAFRPQSVCLYLDQRGRVSLVETEAEVWMGELKSIGADHLEVFGIDGFTEIFPQEGREGFFSHVFRTGDWVRNNFSRAKLHRIPLAPSTHFTVNLDPVSGDHIRAEQGRWVEVVADCQGRARYVDAQKLNRVYNFTGGAVPVERDPANPERWGFRYPSEKESEIVWTAPDVKVYDMQQFPRSFHTNHGFAGLWVDPKSRLVTHVFWSLGENE
jgi:hypothetical protein